MTSARPQQQFSNIRGRITENAPLGEVGWFQAGGKADILFKPADAEDLAAFLEQCPPHVPVLPLGVLSNTIVRDGGVRGVVIRLGRQFAQIEGDPAQAQIYAGAASLDANVAAIALKHHIGGLEYLSGIPGGIGGALRMNAGAYCTETKDVLIEAEMVTRDGTFKTMTPDDMGMSYRKNEMPLDTIFTAARFQGKIEDPQLITDRITAIRESRQNSQPILERTGGSTFANPDPAALEKAGLPPETKTWQLIERAGGRSLKIGGAMMSEKHCNFMINTGGATASDLENLGEEIRKRVYEQSGIMLRWEIRRIGEREEPSPS